MGALLALGSLVLSRVAAESWALLGLVGFVLMAAGYVWKGVRLFRARRHATT